MIGMTDSELIAFHRKLLNAPERMQLYRQAIHAVVRPGDVVIDLGCGSGILGLFACQAGARRVYAVERSEALVVAKELARANGFTDRITYFKGDARELELDEPADVIVSELISKAVIGQKMAETVDWCRDNLLKPGGRIIPAEVELFAAPIESAEIYSKVQLPDGAVYQLDFSVFAQRSFNTPLSVHIPPLALLSAGKPAYHYHAAVSAGADHINSKLVFDVLRSGTLHGFGLWFSSLLADGISLCNEPPGIPAWDNLFLPLQQPADLEAGMTIELSIQGRDDARMSCIWGWETVICKNSEVVSRQKQSTFFARLFDGTSGLPGEHHQCQSSDDALDVARVASYGTD